jgi:hypothetical protein
VRPRPDHAVPVPPLGYLDPGWLYLLAGLALVVATILIPAVRDLDEVRHQRDRALALEHHRLERLQRYQDYLEALERREPALVMALATSQLNQIPRGRTLIFEADAPHWAAAAPAHTTALSASVFAALEPPPPTLPLPRQPDSALYRWTTSERARPWLLAAGGVCLLMGLMPRGRPSERTRRHGGRGGGE